ncbi:MAG: dihydrolipoamide acetyltransferase family protein [Patescibacteria group bacterium]
MFEFKFPDVGEGIHEGEIVRWRVKVGDEIKEDQPLIEVETAKAIVELPSPKSGTIFAIVGKEGEVIHVGDTLVAIGEKGEKFDAASLQKSKSGPGVIGQIPTEEKGVILPARTAGSHQTASTAAGILPRVRKLAQDLGVDLTKVKGSGSGGQVTEDDVRSAKPASQPAPDYSQFGPVDRVPLKGIRKAIAEHMVKSAFTIPHVTHMDEFDASALVKLRESKKPDAEKKNIKLTFLAFIIKAATETLQKHPALNSVLDDSNHADQTIVTKKYFHIGVAVDTPDGLMVPVIKNADQKDVLQIAQEITDLAQKCRDRKIELSELQGGTFSITNIGSIGGIFATPIIPYGQAGNLGVFRMKEKPVAINGKMEIRHIMSLALSFDHRVVDGAEAARFMNDLILLLEKPL